MKPVRGRSYWFPFPQDGAATAHMMTEGEEGSTGFRLALGDGARVRLGGSWDLATQGARVGYRRPIVPSFCCDNLGFRLVRNEEG